jgi:hypothetical protein
MARDYVLERKAEGVQRRRDRAGRNTARRRAIASGKVKKGSSKDVHHKDGNPKNNSPSNLAVVSRVPNRNKSPGRPKGKKDSKPRRKRGKK